MKTLNSSLGFLFGGSVKALKVILFLSGVGILLTAASDRLAQPQQHESVSTVVVNGPAGTQRQRKAVVSAAPAVPRAFVSINGSDTNPCSAVQPCRSFNQALAVVEPGGEIVVQNSGGYSTGFTITQGVTIDAAGFNASVISTSNTDLCTINTGPNDRVVLRGISFHGANVGANAIAITQVGSLYVEHCSIAEFVGDGVHMTNGGNLWVTDTDVRSCDNGLLIQTSSASANLFAQDSRFTESLGGALPAGSGVLVLATGSGSATGWISNCTASDCLTGFGVESTSSGTADLTLTNCRAFANFTGFGAVTFGTGQANMRIANCVATQNQNGVAQQGGAASVLGSNPGTNFFSGNIVNGVTTGSVTLQ